MIKAYITIAILVLGILIPKLFIHDKISLTKEESYCRHEALEELYDNIIETMGINILGNSSVIAKDGSTLKLKLYTLFAIPVSQAVIDCKGGNSYKLDDDIDSFAECKAAGYKVIAGDPNYCNTPSGGHFIDESKKNESRWLNFIDSKDKINFRYPQDLMTSYISLVDWPPQVQILDEQYTCNEAGQATDRAGKTEKRMVDNKEYCVTTVSEGAAGSVYNQYAYKTVKDDKTIVLTFTLRFVQCMNYDQPQQDECLNERQSFDMGSTIDRIVQTLEIGS